LESAVYASSSPSSSSLPFFPAFLASFSLSFAWAALWWACVSLEKVFLPLRHLQPWLHHQQPHPQVHPAHQTRTQISVTMLIFEKGNEPDGTCPRWPPPPPTWDIFGAWTSLGIRSLTWTRHGLAGSLRRDSASDCRCSDSRRLRSWSAHKT